MTNSFSRFDAVVAGLVALAGLLGVIVSVLAGWPNAAIAAAAIALPPTVYGFFVLARCRLAMRRAIGVAQALARGDFEVRDLDCDGHGLTGALTDAINDMADHVDAFVRESSASMEAVRNNRYHRRILPHGMHGAMLHASTIINEATDVIQTRVAAFEASTDDFAATINQIVDSLVAASASMGDASERLGSSTSITDARASAVFTSSQEASTSVERATVAVQALSDSARGIGLKIDRSASIARTAVDRAKETSRIVASLSEAADRIGTVIGLIDQVAKQTNLLALNATIEAARAGEAGKGFAIVASEVKQLASETARATQEISLNISQVQSATRAAVESIGGIGGTIEEIDAITDDMRQAMDAQIAAAGDIVANVGSAHDETQKVSGRITDISSISRQTADLAGGLRDTSLMVSSDGSRLAETVREFLARLRRGPLDRRQNGEPRIDVSIPASVSGKPFTMVDLSSTGARLTGAADDIAVGRHLSLRISETLALPAIVRWCDTGAFGVEFMAGKLSEDAEKWLAGQLRTAATISAAA